MIKDIHQYHVCGWMINRLHLEGRELQCYAVIFSLSQLGEGRYIAGLKFLAEFMQCSQPTASAAIKGLFKKGLIKKDEVTTDYGRCVYYYCSDTDDLKPENQDKGGVKEDAEGVNKKFIDGVNKEFMPKYNNKEYNNKKEKRLSNDNQKKDDYSEEFKQFWKLYNYPKDKKTAYSRWNHLSQEDKELAVKAIPAYFEDCARCRRSKQHPSTYLSKRTFEDDFTVNDKIGFYDLLETDSDEKQRFKAWMRKEHPEIEDTALPLSYEDYMMLVSDEEYGSVDGVEDALKKIEGEIWKYRKCDIAHIVRRFLEGDSV